MKKAVLLALVIILPLGLLPLNDMGGQQEPLLTLAARVELPWVQIGRPKPPDHRWNVRAADLWAQNTIAAVAAGPLIHLVDLTDPRNPSTTTINIERFGECWDLHIKGGFLYAGLNYSADGTSLLIYDITNPKDPKLTGILKAKAGAHNLFVEGQVGFLASFGAVGDSFGLLHLVDLSNPSMPSYLGPLFDPEQRHQIRNIHDVTVIGNRAYLAGWDTGFWVMDFENLSNPKELKYRVVAHHAYSTSDERTEAPEPSRTHNVWPSNDRKVLFTTDEAHGEYVRAWSIVNSDNIFLLGRYRAHEFATPHNVVSDGPFAYVSYFEEGVKVLDASNPRQLKEIASFKTPKAWGVYPFGRYVLVSDMLTGLFVLEKHGRLLSQRP